MTGEGNGWDIRRRQWFTLYKPEGVLKERHDLPYHRGGRAFSWCVVMRLTIDEFDETVLLVEQKEREIRVACWSWLEVDGRWTIICSLAWHSWHRTCQ